MIKATVNRIVRANTTLNVIAVNAENGDILPEVIVLWLEVVTPFGTLIIDTYSTWCTGVALDTEPLGVSVKLPVEIWLNHNTGDVRVVSGDMKFPANGKPVDVWQTFMVNLGRKVLAYMQATTRERITAEAGRPITMQDGFNLYDGMLSSLSISKHARDVFDFHFNSKDWS